MICDFFFRISYQYSDFVVSDGEDPKARSLPKLAVSLIDRTGKACTEAGLMQVNWGPLETEGSQAASSCSKIGVKCRIIQEVDQDGNSATRSTGELLKFEGCDEEGWVNSDEQQWLVGGNKFHFNNLTVENNSNVEDGR